MPDTERHYLPAAPDPPSEPAGTGPPVVGPGSLIGFVGLGHMGVPMAAHLAAAGYLVTGHDISGQARQRARVAAPAVGLPGTLAEAARDAEAVILMLPDSRVIKQVTTEQGLLSAMPEGSLLIDMSSADPAATERLARQAAARDIAVVGAPVSGGVAGAVQASLTIMAGGAALAVERARPVLEVLGRHVLHVGTTPGAGHALKGLNNLLSAIHLLATSEAMVAGQRFGLDPAVMLEAINTSSGRSGSTQAKWPDHILPATYDSGFSASLLVKDMLIGLGVEREFGTGSQLAEAAVDIWRRAATWLPADADHTQIVRWLHSTREGDGNWAE
ncbi:MAG TPA: NAD(P)-dependent oxidoreductase [Trebonia sp.]|nr:NAD(P)-dependent oxidoreductase [Trebonia sp.]